MVATTGAQGDTLNIRVTGNYDKGDFFVQGDLTGLMLDGASTGELAAVQMYGVVNVPKTAANVNIGLGAKVYCTNSNGQVNTTAGGRKFCGYAVEASGTSATHVDILLWRD